MHFANRLAGTQADMLDVSQWCSCWRQDEQADHFEASFSLNYTKDVFLFRTFLQSLKSKVIQSSEKHQWLDFMLCLLCEQQLCLWTSSLGRISQPAHAA